MVKDIWDKIVQWVQGILIGLSIFVGLIIFCWQVYKWLKLGYWISMPLVKAFDYFGIDLTTPLLSNRLARRCQGYSLVSIMAVVNKPSYYCFHFNLDS